MKKFFALEILRFIHLIHATTLFFSCKFDFVVVQLLFSIVALFFVKLHGCHLTNFGTSNIICISKLRTLTTSHLIIIHIVTKLISILSMSELL